MQVTHSDCKHSKTPGSWRRLITVLNRTMWRSCLRGLHSVASIPSSTGALMAAVCPQGWEGSWMLPGGRKWFSALKRRSPLCREETAIARDGEMGAEWS